MRERYGVKKTVDVYSSEFDSFWPLIETDSCVFVPYFFVVCDINENTDIRYKDWIRKNMRLRIWYTRPHADAIGSSARLCFGDIDAWFMPLWAVKLMDAWESSRL